MKGKIIGIRLKDCKTQKRTSVEECIFIKNKGIQGDAYALGGQRQVAFMDNDIKECINDTKIGFCVKKFKENILISDLDFSSLQKGSIIEVGEARVSVTEIGKKCFDGCPRKEIDESCPMKRGCFFARVDKSGRAIVGDQIEKIVIRYEGEINEDRR